MQISCCQGASLPTARRLRCQGSRAIELPQSGYPVVTGKAGFAQIKDIDQGHRSRAQIKDTDQGHRSRAPKPSALEAHSGAAHRMRERGQAWPHDRGPTRNRTIRQSLRPNSDSAHRI